ncbi:hypothetical protein BLS_001638 [Venturia inaequalis]|uniref:Uncharacterized protein n=1 Tax=Venturia inaequalis TaxID=5025 RepID=A0A8H3UWM9_VENIN|nr:hypothetical protein BLS_001638 [Venturia inaequalis]KAE9979071.1 hypothetical protein EG328_001103 [Venturia inaequalis]RDI87449.1 hypothetical protein Vi05172_g2349 [Venturia inaequalis]
MAKAGESISLRLMLAILVCLLESGLANVEVREAEDDLIEASMAGRVSERALHAGEEYLNTVSTPWPLNTPDTLSPEPLSANTSNDSSRNRSTLRHSKHYSHHAGHLTDNMARAHSTAEDPNCQCCRQAPTHCSLQLLYSPDLSYPEIVQLYYAEREATSDNTLVVKDKALKEKKSSLSKAIPSVLKASSTFHPGSVAAAHVSF